MDILVEIIGVIGLVILLAAFVFNVRRKTRHRIILYNSMQFAGALLLCIYAWINSIHLFVFLQAVWALVAAYFIYENIKKKR